MESVKKSKSAPADLDVLQVEPQTKKDEADQEIDTSQSQGFSVTAVQPSESDLSQYNSQGHVEAHQSMSLEQQSSVNADSQRDTLPGDSGLDSVECPLNDTLPNSQVTSSSDESYLALPGFSGLYYYTRLALRTMINPDTKDE